MEVVSVSSLPVASLLWQPRPDAWTLTFVCKATFELVPGESRPAAEQEPVHEEDVHFDDDENRSLYAASDLVPLRLRSDVVVVGSAYAPDERLVRSLFVRLTVGEIDKSLEVFCDRFFSLDGSVVEGARFSQMPLVYERAAGGPDSWNPTGVRPNTPDAYGRTKLPNLQPPGLHIASPSDVVPAIGFGPIAPGWRSRWEKLGRHANGWSPRSLLDRPLPEDLDHAFFNAAPADQQAAMLHEDQRIILENLHPKFPRLVTNLPGLRPRATLEARGKQQPLALTCDTLWIDTDRGICTLTWSGQVALSRPEEPGRVVISADDDAWSPPSITFVSDSDLPPPDAPKRVDTIPPPPAGAAPEDVELEKRKALREARAQPTLPFLPSFELEDARRSTALTGLPFVQASAPAWTAVPAPAPSQPLSTPAVTPPPAVPLPVVPPPVVPPGVAPATPPVVPPPAPSSPGKPSDSPWAAGAPRLDSPPGALSGEVATVAGGLVYSRPADAASGVLAASNAASGPTALPGAKATWSDAPATATSAPPAAFQVRPSGLLDAREILHLVWYAPDSVARICRVPVFRAILDAMEQERSDGLDELEDGSPAKDPVEIEDRRDIFEILARASAQDVDQLRDELEAAVRPDRKFVPPLLLLSGDLSLPFDEREVLKATLGVVTHLVGGDEVLKAAVNDAKDFLASSDVICPPQVVESMTARIRDAFQRARRAVAPDYLETQTERALLERRSYQKRQVLGMTAIRGLFHTAISTAVKPAPVYLPEDIARKLPLFSRFRARLIAELYLQEDQYETHPGALKALALGRVAVLPDLRDRR